MLMIQMQNRQQLQLYLGQVVNMENTGLLHRQLGIELVENGVEVFKPVKRRVIFLGLTVTGAVPNVTIGAEQKAAKVTRYIDEDGNTVKEAGTRFLDADQYIYDAGGKIAYVFKNTLPRHFGYSYACLH